MAETSLLERDAEILEVTENLDAATQIHKDYLEHTSFFNHVNCGNVNVPQSSLPLATWKLARVRHLVQQGVTECKPKSYSDWEDFVRSLGREELVELSWFLKKHGGGSEPRIQAQSLSDAC